jgi:hypothetical protein
MKETDKKIEGTWFDGKIRQLFRLNVMHLLCFLVAVFSVSPFVVSAQADYFRVEQGIPHLPVYENPAKIASPKTGMLIFSHADGKPMVYTGKLWVDFCSVIYEDITSPEYFMVKNGVPYLPARLMPAGTPLSGAVLYSQTDLGIVVANGVDWIKMLNLQGTTLAGNSSFSTDNDILTCRFPVLSADPASAAEGDIYISIPNKCFRYCNGTAWINMTCRASVITSPVTDLVGGAGTGGGVVVSNGGSPIKAVGICWGFSANPDTLLATRTRQKITNGDGLGAFISNLSGLIPSTTYYVRAYACLLYTSPSPRDRTRSRMPSSA